MDRLDGSKFVLVSVLENICVCVCEFIMLMQLFLETRLSTSNVFSYQL